MKIVLLGGNILSVGGIERYCERFVKAFEIYSNIAVTWFHTNTSWKNQGKTRYAIKLLHSLKNILAEIKKLNFREDIIWVQYGNAIDLIVLWIVRLKFKGTVICTSHVGFQWKHMEHPLLRKLSAKILNRTQIVCVLSENQNEELRRMGLEKIRTITTLLPIWINNPQNASMSKRNGLLFAGRVTQEKGIKDLLTAYEIALPNIPQDTILNIAGGGSETLIDEYKQSLARLDIASSVLFHGPLDENMLLKLMMDCKVFVYPSYADAFPLSILEAIAAGMIIIAYNLPGTSEILKKYKCIAVTKADIQGLSNAIVAALNSQNMLLYAEQLRKDYSWENVVEQYIGIVVSCR